MSLQLDVQKKKKRVGTIKQIENITNVSTTPAVWINGDIHWLPRCSEKLIMSESVSVKIKEESIHSKISLQHVHVTNHNNHELSIGIWFMNQPINTTIGHFTFIAPAEDVIYHLVGNEMYLINGYCEDNSATQLTVHPLWNIGAGQIWANEQNGLLQYQPMGKGSYASLLTYQLKLMPHETKKASSWVIKTDDKKELLQLNKTILHKHTSISI